jgi:transcriptional/translational regulatory protein YebC/TACO1
MNSLAEEGITVFQFSTEGMIRLAKRINAADRLARFVKAFVEGGPVDVVKREEEALRLLADWEDAK